MSVTTQTVPGSVHGRFGVLSYVAQVAKDFTARERARAALMFVTIAGLHIIGFAVFILFVVPSHYKGLGIGVAGLAYSLGLRHAFDADHISAIDNTTRKLMNEGKRPLEHRLLVLARALDDRGRDRRRDRRRREGGLRRRLEQQLEPRAVRRDLRHDRLSVVPVPDRAAERRHPRRASCACSDRCARASTTRPSSSASCRTAG